MMQKQMLTIVVLGLLFGCLKIAPAAEPTLLRSPDGTTAASLAVTANGQLGLSILRKDEVVLGPSSVGIVVEGVDLGQGTLLGKPVSKEIRETYRVRGVKSRAINHCIAYQVPVTVTQNGTQWTLEVRVFNDGVAYRYCVPGKGKRTINGETTTWQLPTDAKVWVQHNTANYEGDYRQYDAAAVPNELDGKPVYVGCPVTVELPQGGYALITEAALYNYSGLTLRADGDARLSAVFQDDSRGWQQDGPIVSPWRVTIVVNDLNSLVNSDVVFSLGERPDPALFPEGADAKWILPGKGLCTWAVFLNDGAQWHRQKWFVDMCAAMNCEYLLIDGGWRTEKWGFLSDGGDLWQRLTELCQYAKARNVGIFVWNAFPEGRNDGPGLTDPAVRQEFFRKCRAAGVQGVKIDFFDSECKEIVEVYEDILRETAEQQLMISFHGANKPTGEVRTWPHEITREGIREQEYLLFAGELPLPHYGALPFSRMVVGHGDFLPTYVRPKFLMNTTAVFQLATSVIFTSPFVCWPDHPEAYLESPFLNLIRTLPPVWDETRVLDGSKIGSLVAFARRSGEDWYVAVLNCQDQEMSFTLDASFLGDGPYQTTLHLDAAGSRAASRSETGGTIKRGEQRTVVLQPGGGFVGKFSRPTKYTE